MNTISEAFDVEGIEEALCQLDDVQAARIVVSADNNIEEIHIVAAPVKGAKQLVRDVETTLMARYGIPVNHRKISIAQVNQPIIAGDAATEPDEIPRLRIVSVNTEVSGSRARAVVTLGSDDVAEEGVAEGLASQSEWLRLVAQATLEAVSRFAPPSVCLAVEDVATVNLGKETIAVACITSLGSFGEHTLVGSALIRDSDRESIVRATLDAINRRFSFLKTK
ncbi:MAG: hypothetical protein M1335_02975 [Chloroflexi bacterium]|nr:hypothetical protein [Chloroflexota bacterium]